MNQSINLNLSPEDAPEDSTPKTVTLLNTDGEPIELTKGQAQYVIDARRKMAYNPSAFNDMLTRYRKAAADGRKVNTDGEKDRLSKCVADDGSDFKMSHDLFPIVIRHLAHKHPEIVPAMNIKPSFADKLYPDVRRMYDAIQKSHGKDI